MHAPVRAPARVARWMLLAEAMSSLSRTWALLAVLSGCLVGEDYQVPTDPPSEPGGAAPRGLVREPTTGTVLPGDPSTISLRVAGVYPAPDQPLAVQVLSDPGDLSSWVTIATARSATESVGVMFAFAVDVRPVAQTADEARWPAGGVLRLRVLDPDGAALAVDETTPDASVLVVVNPADRPSGWTYLTDKAPGSVEETLEYYAAIDAPPTLDAFIERYGFPGDEVSAVYYNAGDLGIGREMHCRQTATPAGGLACYVRNFGVFGGDRADAIAQLVAGGTPLATVAMVYTPPIDAPNAVTFMAYGPSGELVTEAQLDTLGDNVSIPHNCINCHGGRSRYDAANNAVIGARFLPFDPAAFAYAAVPELSLNAQEDRLRRLNRLVAQASPTAGIRELIDGMFPAGSAPYDPSFVPPGWSATAADARVYREVIAPYCRSCHVSFESGAGDPVAFSSAQTFRAFAGSIVQRVCGDGPRGMPSAEQTTQGFFRSSARGVLLAWLGAPGACAPAAAPALP